VPKIIKFYKLLVLPLNASKLNYED